MDPISGLAALYEILKRKAGDRTSAAERSAGTSSTQAQRSHRLAFDDLQQQICLKLKALPRESLTSPATKRWLIASLLSWEFHDGLQNEAKFAALVRGVQQSIDADERLKVKFERVVEQLYS